MIIGKEVLSIHKLTEFQFIDSNALAFELLNSLINSHLLTYMESLVKVPWIEQAFHR